MRIGSGPARLRHRRAALGDKARTNVDTALAGLTPPYLDCFAWLASYPLQPGIADPVSRLRPGDAGACDSRTRIFSNLRRADFIAEWKMGRHPGAGGQWPWTNAAIIVALCFTHAAAKHQQKLSRPAPSLICRRH